MKNIQRARYSYLSAKIAKQRAYEAQSKKINEKAEKKRQELRDRQEHFQRDVTQARNIIRKLYPECKFNHRRVLENTAHPIGTPLFRHYMLQMGYLPSKVVARPKTATGKMPKSKPPANIPEASQRNLSKLNFGPLNATKKKPITRSVAATKLQGLIRGFIVRAYMTKTRRMTLIICRWHKRQKARHAFVRALAEAHIESGGTKHNNLIQKYR